MLRPSSQYRTRYCMFTFCACDWLSSAVLRKGRMCVCTRECVGHTAVLGGQVFSCFCFLGANTGVNIQKMMSQPQQRARRPYKAKLSFHRDLSNIKTICCPTVHVYGRVFGGTLGFGPPANKLSRHTTEPNRSA